MTDKKIWLVTGTGRGLGVHLASDPSHVPSTPFAPDAASDRRVAVTCHRRTPDRSLDEEGCDNASLK